MKPNPKKGPRFNSLPYWKERASVAERRCRDANVELADAQTEHMRLLDALEIIVDAVAKHKECPF